MTQPLQCISNHSPSNSITSPPVSSENQINYLNRCVKNISQETETIYRCSKYFNYAVIAISSILFTAAAVASIVTTLLFSPDFMPITGFALTCCTYFFARFVKSRMQAIASSNNSLETIKKIREHEQHLNNLDEPENSSIKEELRLLEFNEMENKSPILAHYFFWKEMMQDCNSIVNELEVRINNLSNNSEELVNLRIAYLAKKEEALLCKVQAAFYLGISFKNNPLAKEMHEVIHFSPTLT
jgi:hypothetical protein